MKNKITKEDINFITNNLYNKSSYYWGRDNRNERIQDALLQLEGYYCVIDRYFKKVNSIAFLDKGKLLYAKYSLEQNKNIDKSIDYLESMTSLKSSDKTLHKKLLKIAREIILKKTKNLYFQDTPALRYLCKNRKSFFKEEFMSISNEALNKMKRNKILEISGFKSTNQIVKLFSKLDFELFINKDLMLVLRKFINNTSDKILNRLSAVKEINILHILLLKNIPNKITNNLLMQLPSNRFIDYKLLDNKFNCNQDDFSFFDKKIRDLNELFISLNDFMNNPKSEFNKFPEEITNFKTLKLEQITSLKEFRNWGKKMKQCLVSMPFSSIAKNHYYFKILAPEKGTLEIYYEDEKEYLGDDYEEIDIDIYGYQINQMNNRGNRGLSSKTEFLIEEWLEKFQRETVSGYLVSNKFLSMEYNTNQENLNCGLPFRDEMTNDYINEKEGISSKSDAMYIKPEISDINDSNMNIIEILDEDILDKLQLPQIEQFKENNLLIYSILFEEGEYLFTMENVSKIENKKEWEFTGFLNSEKEVPYKVKVIAQKWLNSYYDIFYNGRIEDIMRYY